MPGLLREAFNAVRGRIVVADRDLVKGFVVAEYHGQLISRKEGLERELLYENADSGSFLMFFRHDGQNLWYMNCAYLYLT